MEVNTTNVKTNEELISLWLNLKDNLKSNLPETWGSLLVRNWGKFEDSKFKM